MDLTDQPNAGDLQSQPIKWNDAHYVPGKAQLEIPSHRYKNEEIHLAEMVEIALQVSDAREEKVAFDPKFYEEVGRRLWYYLVDEGII